MRKQRMLICGASGFIGRNLFEYFAKKSAFDVYGTYHRNRFSSSSKLIKVDLTDKNDVKKVTRNIDILIQAAATTSGVKDIINKPYYHVTDNAIMNSLLFQAAHDNHVLRVIFFSCTVMYPQLGRPVKETDMDLNQDIYRKYFGVGWTKVYLEKLCEFYAGLGRTKYTVIRHSNIYGPYDKYDPETSHVFGASIAKVMSANGDKITVWGEGKEKRDLLYVSDLIRFVEMVITKQDYDFDIFNVGLGKSVSVSDLVKKIIHLSGKKLSIKYDKAKPTVKTRLTLDTTRAKKKFGWQVKVTLEEGIKMTLKWYEKNYQNQKI